jgi:hypothetical protein
MNNLIKKIVNFKSYINANPFSFVRAKFGKFDADVSDFFAFRTERYETIFIAENNLALLVGQPIECRHIFHFFDSFGNPCGVFKVSSENFHYKLSINDQIIRDVKFGSFTHHVQYSDETISQYGELLTDISFQHRGYTGFRMALESGFSYVHGNFGGMYVDCHRRIRSLARLRGKHTYTPQFTIKPNYSYDFIFSNPTRRNTCIKFLLTNDNFTKVLSEECLNPHGTYKFTLNESNIQNDCNISWETNLPVGRCLVFENNGKYFDVFHS